MCPPTSKRIRPWKQGLQLATGKTDGDRKRDHESPGDSLTKQNPGWLARTLELALVTQPGSAPHCPKGATMGVISFTWCSFNRISHTWMSNPLTLFLCALRGHMAWFYQISNCSAITWDTFMKFETNSKHIWRNLQFCLSHLKFHTFTSYYTEAVITLLPKSYVALHLSSCLIFKSDWTTYN